MNSIENIKSHFEKCAEQDLIKEASKLDKLVSMGMNMFDRPTTEIIASRLQNPALKKAILRGDELTPVQKILFRKEFA